MAIKLYAKLQTPTIELPIKIKTADGLKDNFKAGFKRYTADLVQDKYTELRAKFPDLKKAEEGHTLSQDDEESNLEVLKEINKSIVALLKREIVYLKDMTLSTEDETGLIKELHIADSRIAKPVDGLWGSSEECLNVLLDTFLESAPYRSSLHSAMYIALANDNIVEAKLGN